MSCAINKKLLISVGNFDAILMYKVPYLLLFLMHYARASVFLFVELRAQF